MLRKTPLFPYGWRIRTSSAASSNLFFGENLRKALEGNKRALRSEPAFGIDAQRTIDLGRWMEILSARPNRPVARSLLRIADYWSKWYETIGSGLPTTGKLFHLMDTSAFIIANPTGEPMTSGLPVSNRESQC